MTKSRARSWHRVKEQAIEAVEELVSRRCRSFPTDLQDLAIERSVEYIEFLPLLVEGGILVTRNGFIINVRCDPSEGERLTELFQSDGTGRALPRTIVNRSRFTIAHELAHTFFYDTSRTPPSSLIETADIGNPRKLESACNRIASHLLLPEELLIRKYPQLESCDPELLCSICRETLVSRVTLTARLSSVPKMSLPEGVVVCAERGSTGDQIRAIWRHYSLRELWLKLTKGAYLHEFVYHPDLIVFGGEQSWIEKELVLTSGERLQFRFCCEEKAPRRGTSFFVSAERLR